MISYFIAQVNSKKKLKPEDVLKFPWDKKSAKTQPTITKEEMIQLQERAKKFAERLNKN